MKRAAAYARFSSDRQNELSNQDQIENILRYAKTNGFQIVRTYQDEELSGFLGPEHREGLRSLMQESKRYNFQYILVWNFDRFARSRRIAQNLKQELKETGLELISVTQALPTGSSRVLVESLYEGVAEWYSWNFAENVMRGTIASIKRGDFAGIHAPFGYKDVRDEKGKRHIIIDKETAPFVRQVFAAYVNGESLSKLAAMINEQGYQTIRGNPYSIDAVSWMLKNPLYKGILVYNNKRSKKRGEKNPFTEVVTVEHPELTIVPPETWERAQRLRRSHQGVRSQKAYLLKGLVQCAKCGHYITRHYRGANIQDQQYGYTPGKNYTCNWCKKHYGRSGMVGEQKLNQLVMNHMHKIFNDIETNVDSFVAHVNKELKDKRERLAIDRILGEIADINERIKNITHAIEMGKGINTLLDRLEELQNEKARAETNLRESRAIERQLEEFSAEYVLGNLETLKEKMNSMETAHEVLKGITTMKVDLDSRVFEIVVFNMVSTFAV